MLNTKDYYAKLHIISKRKLRENIENIVRIQVNKLHHIDRNTIDFKINRITPCETINPSFFKFEVKLPKSFIQNNHNKVVYAISIWDRKTNKLISASNFKATNMYVISKHKPAISFNVSVEL